MSDEQYKGWLPPDDGESNEGNNEMLVGGGQDPMGPANDTGTNLNSDPNKGLYSSGQYYPQGFIPPWPYSPPNYYSQFRQGPPPYYPPTGYFQTGPYPPHYPNQPSQTKSSFFAIVAVLCIVLGVGLGVGTAALFKQVNSTQTSSNSGANLNPVLPTFPGSNSGTSPVTTTPKDVSSVEAGIVDINTVLKYQQAQAAGTGIVLTSNGEILTNNHVIEGATSISVTDIGNGRTYSAKIVGTDASSDIAVIQLAGASGLATAPLGNSSQVGIGDAITAIGNAGGVGGTPRVVTGTVKALNQSVTAASDFSGASENLTGMIEIQADIVPGDSGGPLVNSSGKVVGIDTAASSGFQLQTNSVTGFAIPINKALSIAKLIESGKSSSTIHIGQQGFLGVSVEDPSSASNPPVSSGAYIAGVLSGSPAAQAGLTSGDVIVSVNGTQVTSANELTNVMGQYHPGNTVNVGYVNSNGQHATTSVTLTAGPPQ